MNNNISLKDKVLSILCYLWLFPLLIMFWPKRSAVINKHLIFGIILSLFITVWIYIVLRLIKQSVNLNTLNAINIVVMIIVIIFQIIQIVLIIKKR